MIIASAIKLKRGDVFIGKRHGNCFKNYRDIMMSSENNWNEDTLKKECKECEQGFITSDLKFLTREEALDHAKVFN